MSFLEGIISYVQESFAPSAEVTLLSHSPAAYYNQYQLAKDPIDINAGASFVQTRRLIQRKINANNRRLAKRATYISDNWPAVEQQVDRERSAIAAFSQELAGLPRILETLGHIHDSIQTIAQRAEALEELLTVLEVNDLQMGQEKWKVDQNRELNEYHLQMQRTLLQRKQAFELRQSEAVQEMNNLRFQCKQAAARSSLFKKKIENVDKEIRSKEAYFESAEYRQTVEARDEALREKKIKKAFEEAFNRDMDEYREKQVLRAAHPETAEAEPTDVETLDLAPQAELDAFLGPQSDMDDTEETAPEDASSPPVEILSTEMDPENDPELY